MSIKVWTSNDQHQHLRSTPCRPIHCMLLLHLLLWKHQSFSHSVFPTSVCCPKNVMQFLECILFKAHWIMSNFQSCKISVASIPLPQYYHSSHYCSCLITIRSLMQPKGVWQDCFHSYGKYHRYCSITVSPCNIRKFLRGLVFKFCWLYISMNENHQLNKTNISQTFQPSTSYERCYSCCCYWHYHVY